MPDKNTGFTLLELIISLTIIAIIVTVVQNGFHISTRAWEKGETAVDRLQAYRFGLELIQAQLSSASPMPATENVGEASDSVFTGDESSMEFSARTSLIPGIPSGMVRVWYRVDKAEDGGKTLSFMEERFFSSPSLTGQDRPAEKDWHVLLSGIKDLAFDYLPSIPTDDETGETPLVYLTLSPEIQSDETSLWQSSWESTQQRSLPLAVRVRFQADEKSAPLYLVVPVGRGLDG